MGKISGTNQVIFLNKYNALVVSRRGGGVMGVLLSGAGASLRW